MIDVRMTRCLRGILLVVLVFASSVQAKEYQVELSAWIFGERQTINQPILLGTSGVSVELGGRHRLDLAVETVDDPLAPDGSVWMTVDIFNWDASKQDWVFFTDTLLGAPMGQTQVLTISGEGAGRDPKDTTLHLEAVVNLAPGEDS